METPTIENQLHFDNAGLRKRNALLEETLKENEVLLTSLADKVQEILAKNSAAV